MLQTHLLKTSCIKSGVIVVTNLDPMMNRLTSVAYVVIFAYWGACRSRAKTGFYAHRVCPNVQGVQHQFRPTTINQSI
jgi:hypothetical protein